MQGKPGVLEFSAQLIFGLYGQMWGTMSVLTPSKELKKGSFLVGRIGNNTYRFETSFHHTHNI